MSEIIEPIQTLAAQFAKFPGIGAKTALRLAFFVLSMDPHSVRTFADALTSAKERVRYCSVCGMFTEADPCSVCSDPKRTSDMLCIVRDARDVFALEKTREFHGRYHVLQGVISPMEGIGPDDIRINELLTRVKSEQVREVIIATSLDVEGEVTANYIQRQLKPMGVVVSRIAYGVPVGGDLEFTDELTLIKALEGRREM